MSAAKLPQVKDLERILNGTESAEQGKLSNLPGLQKHRHRHQGQKKELHFKGRYRHAFLEQVDAPKIERFLDEVAEDSRYLERFARTMSQARKRPVLVLCNARSGSHLYPGLSNSLEDLTAQADRDEFAAEVRGNPHWGEPGGKMRAAFQTAERWLGEGRMTSFIYPVRHIKVASFNRGDPQHSVVATPHGLDGLIDEGCDMVFADYSSRDFPGSFSKKTGSPPCPGFKEFLLESSRRYRVLLSSRRPSASLKARPAAVLLGACQSERPVAICLNVLDDDTSDLYSFIDNDPALLGEFGYRMGKDHDGRKFRPTKVKTTLGRMELGDFVRKYLGQR